MLDAGVSPAPEARPRARQRRALVADLFCGAGSLSMGAHDAMVALGYDPTFVAPYRFAGNKTEVVRQIGQAVPYETARALTLALMGGEP